MDERLQAVEEKVMVMQGEVTAVHERLGSIEKLLEKVLSKTTE